MEDIQRLADRVTVFRDSRYIGTWPIGEISQEKLIVAMVGREISKMFPKRQIRLGDEVLRVEGLTRVGFFRDVSFSLRRGEILALTGLVGAGRTEVCESIYGVFPWDAGSVYVSGSPAAVRTPMDALGLGIGYLPEDRQKQGLILDWAIGKNITLPSLGKYSRLGWMDEKAENIAAGALTEKLAVKTKSIFTRASAMSGGNQQKVVVAKILTNELKVIILDEPTKGVDVAAKAAIYEIIGDLAEQGYGVILVSSEMPEVLELSDRIVVMKEGRVTACLDTASTNQEEILHAAMVMDVAHDSAARSGEANHGRA
jgi:rhamnose transport system ATP-binding protein